MRASTSVFTISFSASESCSLVRSRVPIMSCSDCRQARVKIETRIGDLKQFDTMVFRITYILGGPSILVKSKYIRVRFISSYIM